MIAGIGTDIELVKRFKNFKKNENFFKRVFSEAERYYCNKQKNYYVHYAGKFCAKEAVIKAMGKGKDFREIEILNNSLGQPEVYIDKKFAKKIKCTISHSGEYAIAFVIIENE